MLGIELRFLGRGTRAPVSIPAPTPMKQRLVQVALKSEIMGILTNLQISSLGPQTRGLHNLVYGIKCQTTRLGPFAAGLSDTVLYIYWVKRQCALLIRPPTMTR